MSTRSERHAPLNMPWARLAPRRQSSQEAAIMDEVADESVPERPTPVKAQTNVASPLQLDVALASGSQDFSEQAPIASQYQSPAVDKLALLLPAVSESALIDPLLMPAEVGTGHNGQDH